MGIERAAVRLADQTWASFSTAERVALVAGSVLCIALTVWLSSTFDIPATPGRGGSLLQQSPAVVAVGIAAVAVVATAALAAVIASRVHFEGGLFCACIGMTALSLQMGPSRFALFGSSIGANVYLLLAFELLLLFAAVAAAWTVLRFWTRSGWLPPEPSVHGPQADADEPLDQKLLATAAQALVMTVLMLLLTQSDQKAQVIASLAIASWLGALAAHHFVVTGPSVWFWSGPLIVGLIGYVVQYFNPGDWMIGEPRGFFANLARPMPLDYAGVGTAGALVGYWTSQRWHHAGVNVEQTDES